MATADELLGTIAEVTDDILVVDLNTRVISIPATIKVLGVESDDDVKRLQFKVPRYYGEFDLSTFDIRVNFKNAAGGGDFYPTNDVTVSDDGNTFSFSWLVDRVAFVRKGNVEFSLCMKLYDNNGVVVKEFNTAKATLPVLEGLETEKALVENNPSAFDEVLYRLYAVEAATGLGKEGYCSIAKVEETDNGVLVTIINQDGQTQAVIKDGYTPGKGVDYWTEEDQIAIKSEVVSYAEEYISAFAPTTETAVLSADNWVDKQQAITVDSVSTDSIVIVAPEPSSANYSAYTNAAIRCVSQTDSRLVFECESQPLVDVNVNISVHRSVDSFDDGGRLIVTDDGEGNVTILGSILMTDASTEAF